MFKPDVQYSDFNKVDLRVAVILEASPVPDTDKLMLLKVDLGSEQRQIVAGIKQYYTPESLIGLTILVVANLAPRTIRGIVSHGMVLAATTSDNGLALVTPNLATPAGTEVH